MAVSNAARKSNVMTKKTSQHYITATYTSTASVSASTYKDPPYMVDVEDSEGGRDEGGGRFEHSVKVLVLTPKQKRDMYELNKQNPDEHTVSALAKQFKCREERVQAVLVLQRMREEAFERLGVNNPEWATIHGVYCKHFDAYKIQKDAERVKALAERPEVDANDFKKKKSKKHVAAAEAELDEWHVPEDSRGHFNVIEEVVSSTAAEVNKSAAEVSQIVADLSKHRYLLYSEQQQAEQSEERVAELVSQGAVIGETAVTTTRKALGDDYYPLLFGDDEDFETHRLDLVRQLMEDTKAQVQDGAKANAMFMRNEDRLKEAVPDDAVNSADVDTSQLGRFKFAFRDLQLKDEQPTMIRTRSGKWRQATPLEESQRSWVRNPTKAQMEMYRERVKRFEDPDGDEAAARQLVLDKTARRKAQLAAGE